MVKRQQPGGGNGSINDQLMRKLELGCWGHFASSPEGNFSSEKLNDLDEWDYNIEFIICFYPFLCHLYFDFLKSIGHDQRQRDFDHKATSYVMICGGSHHGETSSFSLVPSVMSFFMLLFWNSFLGHPVLCVWGRRENSCLETSRPNVASIFFFLGHTAADLSFLPGVGIRCLLSEVSSPEDGSVHIPAGRPGVHRHAAHVCGPAPVVWRQWRRDRERKHVWPSLL